MNGTFEPFCEQVLFPHEGGYVDHPRDPGGATNMGITLATLSRYRRRPVTKAEVKAMKRAEAMDIYRGEFWVKCGADLMPAGPDAALFDVAVNSGVGRAKQWKPLTYGKTPVEAIKAICARRRSFFQSLSTFSVFGKGWMRRVNAVEAWSIKWAVTLQGKPADASKILTDEAKKSRTKATASGAGAGTVVAAPAVPEVQEAASDVSWVAIAIIAVPFVAAVVFMAYSAVAHSSRASAMQEAANG